MGTVQKLLKKLVLLCVCVCVSLQVVPVVRAAVIVESVSGTQTESEMSQGESLSPVLLNADTCANVVLKVSRRSKDNRTFNV